LDGVEEGILYGWTVGRQEGVCIGCLEG
jgi:hypothetical protein